MLCPLSRCHGELRPDTRRPGIWPPNARCHGVLRPDAWRPGIHRPNARCHHVLRPNSHCLCVSCWEWYVPCKGASRASQAPGASGRRFFFLMPRQPLNTYFAELLDITTELAGSEEALSNMVLKNHIYTTLPPAYAVTIEILQSSARVTVQEVIDALNQCETNRSMTTKPDAVSDALYTQQGGRGGRGGYQGRYQGNERSQMGWCDWCKTGTHSTSNCWSKKNNK